MYKEKITSRIVRFGESDSASARLETMLMGLFVQLCDFPMATMDTNFQWHIPYSMHSVCNTIGRERERTESMSFLLVNT